MSNVKKSNTWTMEEVQKKQKKIDIDLIRFTDSDVNFDVKYDGDQKPSKCSLKLFLANFGELHI